MGIDLIFSIWREPLPSEHPSVTRSPFYILVILRKLSLWEIWCLHLVVVVFLKKFSMIFLSVGRILLDNIRKDFANRNRLTEICSDLSAKNRLSAEKQYSTLRYAAERRLPKVETSRTGTFATPPTDTTNHCRTLLAITCLVVNFAMRFSQSVDMNGSKHRQKLLGIHFSRDMCWRVPRCPLKTSFFSCTNQIHLSLNFFKFSQR